MKREHNWNREDAIITLFYSEYGTTGLLVPDEKELAESVIGSSLASLKMMVLNFNYLKTLEEGFDHVSDHQKQVFDQYHNTSKEELTEIVNNIILSRDQVQNKEDFKAAKKVRDAKTAAKAKAQKRQDDLDAYFRSIGKDPSKMKKLAIV
jgi:hypothetical protein